MNGRRCAAAGLALAMMMSLAAVPAVPALAGGGCDGPRELSIDEVTSMEGMFFGDHTLYGFTVKSSGCAKAGTVDYRTVDRETDQADYQGVAEMLTFDDGDMADQMIWVCVRDDTVLEMDESFLVVLDNPTGGLTDQVLHDRGIGIILNDDPAAPPAPGDPKGVALPYRGHCGG